MYTLLSIVQTLVVTISEVGAIILSVLAVLEVTIVTILTTNNNNNQAFYPKQVGIG
jgi:hypothetical protein